MVLLRRQVDAPATAIGGGMIGCDLDRHADVAMANQLAEEEEEEEEKRDAQVHGGTAFLAAAVAPPATAAAVPSASRRRRRRSERPGSPMRGKATLRYATTRADLKGEDRFDIRPLMQKAMGESADDDKVFSYFAVLDGHNGQSCCDFAVHNLLLNMMEFVDRDDDWSSALPQAMVNGFVKTHRDFANLKLLSGSTVTAVIVDGLDVYVAGAGDSAAILDDGKKVHALTVDHRVDTNERERARILRGGGSIKRVEVGGTQHGPLRVDGTLCVSRSLGDLDVSALVLESPDVCVVRLPPTGGRIIIASDGVWDALSATRVAKLARKYTSNLTSACERVVKKALKAKGFRDDTTVVIVDVLPASSRVGTGTAAGTADPAADFRECIKMPASARVPPSITTYENLVPTLTADIKARTLSKDFHELEGIRVRAPVGLYGTFSEDTGFGGAKTRGGTNLHSYNRGVAMAQHNLEKSRLRGRLRDGNLKEGDDVVNLAGDLGYNTTSPEMGQLNGYPQRILVHKLQSVVDQ